MEFGIYIMLALIWFRLDSIKDILKKIAEELRGAE